MMATQLAYFLAGTLMFMGMAQEKPDAQDCPQLSSATPSQMIAYLKEQAHSSTEAACVIDAIRRLGESKSPAAVEVLTDYLDYKRPLTRLEKAGFWISRGGRLSELYPAVSALFLIGQPAAPGLVQAISNAPIPSMKRENAIRTLMLLYSSDDAIAGIKILKSAAADERDAARASKLDDAAKAAVNWCPPDLRSRCEAAANSHESPR